MNRGIAGEVRILGLLLLVCAVFGAVNGYPFITMVMGLLGYLGWTLWNISHLSRWLGNNSRQLPPDLHGIWGEIADSIVQSQRQHRRERAMLQTVIKRGQETTRAIRDGIILLNSDAEIEWFNSAATQLVGLRNQDQGQSLFNFVRHPRFVQYMNKSDFSEPLDLPSPQNDAMRLQYQLTRFGLGDCLVVVRDVTRLYKLEQMRKDFVANVSHELRTPLTVLRGYVETLGMSEELPPKWQKPLQQMEQQSVRMSALIQDLIELSQLETNENLSTHRPVDIKLLLQTVQSDALALSADSKHQVKLKCPAGIQLLGSEKELQSAFSNLVFNAVKYSPAGTDITITVRNHPLGLLVAVKDKGPGIDSIHLPRLTERFYRVNSSRNSSTGGTGLGLAIVKHVMLRHSGRLNIKSRLGKGSTFTCIFPIRKILPATQSTTQSTTTEP